MRTLADELTQLAEHPRAVAWTVRLHSGFSGSAMVRDYVLFAPPTVEAGQAVLSRVHNAILMLNPAAAQVIAPLPAERLEPFLTAVRGIHRIGIFLEGEAVRPLPQNFDLPSMDVSGEHASVPGLAAGLDIGGTGMKACVLRDGVPLRFASAPTWPDGERGIESLIRRARELLEDVAAGEQVGSLGIGFASPMGVGGKVSELSTVMRAKVGDVAAFEHFAERVGDGFGRVAMFNDLANLGRYLSSKGARRLIRLQIGTSFGGCWIDSNGTVYATEMGRLIVDVGPDSIPHTYLPIRGAVRSYLSNKGLAEYLAGELDRPFDPRTAGHSLRELLLANNPVGTAAVARMAETMRGVVCELHAILPGVTAVECGGSMLQGAAGKYLYAQVVGRVPVEFRISNQPGHDGAIAAAQAPLVEAALKGMRRVG